MKRDKVKQHLRPWSTVTGRMGSWPPRPPLQSGDYVEVPQLRGIPETYAQVADASDQSFVEVRFKTRQEGLYTQAIFLKDNLRKLNDLEVLGLIDVLPPPFGDDDAEQ